MGGAKNLRMASVLATLILLIAPVQAFAGEGLFVAAGVMALTNSTEQGGQGSAGSTILTETEMTYHGSYWGMGGYFQFDKQGSNQTDTGAGIKGELHADPFYFEFGYTFFMQRAFTDRSIANQRGNGMLLGVGTRFPVGAGSTYQSGTFLQFSYKYRTQQINDQDGEKLDEPIKQTDAYPMFGIGYDF
jgi:hypothetical protein